MDKKKENLYQWIIAILIVIICILGIYAKKSNERITFLEHIVNDTTMYNNSEYHGQDLSDPLYQK